MALCQGSSYVPKIDYPTFSDKTCMGDVTIPYKCMLASESIDIWAYGLIFYHLLNDHQSTLLPTNAYEEFTDSKEITKAATWTDTDLHHLIDVNIGDK